MKRLTLIDKAFLLKRTPLFSPLDLDLLLPIADKLGLIEYDPQEPIFNIGEEGNRMYLIIKGVVDIYDENKNLLVALEGEDFFGDESVFNERARGYSAIAKTETHVLTLSRTHLLTIISECPSVAVGFLQVYTSNLSFRPRKRSMESS